MVNPTFKVHYGPGHPGLITGAFVILVIKTGPDGATSCVSSVSGIATAEACYARATQCAASFGATLIPL